MAQNNVALSTQSAERVESFLYPIRISIVLMLQVKGPQGVTSVICMHTSPASQAYPAHSFLKGKIIANKGDTKWKMISLII